VTSEPAFSSEQIAPGARTSGGRLPLVLHLERLRTLLRWQAIKLASALCVGGIVFLHFRGVAKLTLDRSYDYDLSTAIDALVPLLPWTWWLYLPVYLLSILAAVLAARDRRTFFRCLAAFILAEIFSSCIFFLVPSSFPRPEGLRGTGLTPDLLSWMWQVDPPNNTFPSMHVALVVLVALGLWEELNPLRYLNTALAVAIVASIHTVKQHYVIDSIGGVVMAIGCFTIVFRLYPKVFRRPMTPRGVRILARSSSDSRGGKPR